MRLKYIFRGQEKEPHPFYIKSHWEPRVQPSVDLENYLEGVKTKLAEIKLSKPKHSLPHKERKAIRELKTNSEKNIKKADKGSTTVIMNKKDKIEEGQVQLDDKPLEWKRYIDDIFSLWDTRKEGIDLFILEANKHHASIEFTANISEKDTNFRDTTVFKGERFYEESILDIRTHFKPTETFQDFQYT